MNTVLCAHCGANTDHLIVDQSELPPGLGLGSCIKCNSVRIIMTDATLAPPMFTTKGIRRDK